MPNKLVTLDVREDIQSGREPFTRIMRAVEALRAKEDLRLISPFEPAPLYRVLQNLGFSHRTSPRPDGDFEVVFSRHAQEMPVSPTPTQPAVVTSESDAEGRVIEVDARGLEPPQPLVRILEAVAALSKGEKLRALTDRRPMHLYAQLEERGFAGETQEQPDGGFVTYVHRK